MNRTTAKLGIIAMMCSTAVFARAETKAPCGFVADVKGRVTIERGKTKNAVEGLNALYPGDVVKVGDKGAVTIALCDLEKAIAVPGPATAAISEKGVQFKEGKAGKETPVKAKSCKSVLQAAAKYDKVKFASNVGETAGALQVRGGAGASIVSVKLATTKVLPTTPLFVWNRVEGAAEYNINIMDASGDPVLETKTERNTYEYPEDAPALKPGITYTFDIEARDDQGIAIESGTGEFTVMDEQQQKDFNEEEKSLKEIVVSDPKSARGYILLGRFYEANGLLIQAIANYESALKFEPQNEGLKDILNTLKAEAE